jgi:signal transduction histidine kinase
MVKQILLNLLSNAVKFTPSGGRIKLSAGVLPGGNINFTVSDSGIGIPPDQIRRVMEPFVQVEGTFSRRYAGTGLGLPLSKAFAELHGAALDIASSVGAGTTITVTFPASRSIKKASAA